MNTAATPDTEPDTEPGFGPGTADERGAETAAVRARVATAFGDRGDPALIELTVAWLLSKKEGGRPNYLAGVASWLRSCHDPLQAHPSQVEIWLEYMTVEPPRGRLPRPVTTGTLLQRLRAVSSWYTHLIAHHACDHNPAAGIHPPRAPHTPRRTPQALSLAATTVLIEHALARAEHRDTEAAWRDAALTTALFYTRTDPRTLITAQLTDLVGLPSPSSPLTLRAGPDDPAGFLIELPDPVAGALRAYLQHRAIRHHLDTSQLHGRLLVTAPTRRGTPGDQPLSPQNVNITITKLAHQAGLQVLSRITPRPAGSPTSQVCRRGHARAGSR